MILSSYCSKELKYGLTPKIKVWGKYVDHMPPCGLDCTVGQGFIYSQTRGSLRWGGAKQEDQHMKVFFPVRIGAFLSFYGFGKRSSNLCSR